MKRFIVLFFSLLFFTSGKDIPVQWVESLAGDFSFSPKHTLQCEAWCYEFAGTSEIEAIRINKDSIRCHTFADAGTHSVLEFYIVNNLIVNPRIELNSITDGKFTYPCKDGFVKIDKNSLKKGILKAEFDMTFDHPENQKKAMYWKGKILAKIK
jgi:hypothetical protein